METREEKQEGHQVELTERPATRPDPIRYDTLRASHSLRYRTRLPVQITRS